MDSGTVSATVSQATGTNLHAVIDSGSTTAVTQATASNLNAQVVGAAGSGITGNPVLVAGSDGTNTRTLLVSTTGQQHILLDSGSTTAVTQATGTNLHTVVHSGTITATVSGTATVTPAGSTIWEVSPTTAANTGSNPFFNSITDGTTSLSAAISALGTAPTGTDVMAVNAVNLPTAAAGGALSAVVKSAQATAVNIKASAGNLYGLAITSATYSRFYTVF